MPVKIIKADINSVAADAAVIDPENTLLCAAVRHVKCGKIPDKCRKFGGCKNGQAKITKALGKKVKYVIYTVGPVWKGGGQNETELLRSCYNESLNLALDKKLKNVAIPLISTGAYGYTEAESFQIAFNTCYEFICNHEYEMNIIIVLNNKNIFRIDQKQNDSLISYLKKRYILLGALLNKFHIIEAVTVKKERLKKRLRKPYKEEWQNYSEDFESMGASSYRNIEASLKSVDESFHDMLFRKIDEKGITDAECYKKAYVSRKLFSKIRCSREYHPKKVTVIAFAIALDLSLDETKELLYKAGYALTHSSKFDIIIEYCIENKIYDINEVNHILYKFDQALIGVE